MLKKVAMLLFLSMFAAACGNLITGPSDATPTYPSAHGTVPEWVFFEGHVPFIPDGTYEMYFGNGVGGDPEVASAIEQRWLPAANTMTRGRVRFVRSYRPDAPFSIAVAPEKMQNPTALAQNELTIETPTYFIRSGHIHLRLREYALNNVALHEIGHSLFGTGHSGVQGDIMGRRDYSQPTFSTAEETTWDLMRQAGPGATAYSQSTKSTFTIIVN